MNSKDLHSPAQRIWARFRRNKSAVGGLIFILLLLLMGILGYLITLDQTPMANTMHLQLSNKEGDGMDEQDVIKALRDLDMEKVKADIAAQEE